MDNSTKSSMTEIQNIHSFDDLKAFAARVSKLNINWTLRDKLIRQASQNYFDSCPAI